MSYTDVMTKPVIAMKVWEGNFCMSFPSVFVNKKVPARIPVPSTDIYKISISETAFKAVSYMPNTSMICEVLIPGSMSATAMIIPHRKSMIKFF